MTFTGVRIMAVSTLASTKLAMLNHFFLVFNQNFGEVIKHNPNSNYENCMYLNQASFQLLGWKIEGSRVVTAISEHKKLLK